MGEQVRNREYNSDNFCSAGEKWEYGRREVGKLQLIFDPKREADELNVGENSHW